MSNIFTHKKQSRFIIAAVACCAMLGVAIVYMAHAATNNFLSVETETGARTGNASSVFDSSASGSNAVKFSATASAELKGWELTSSAVGLAPFGISCDSLPAYTGPEAPANGAVITGKRFTSPLYVYNGTITITKSCFKTTSNGPYGMVTTWNPNIPSMKAQGQVTITDSEFDGSLMSNQEVAYTAAFMGVAILERNYIHDFGSGIAFYNTGTTYTANAINNYVEKMRAYGNAATSGSHNETFTVRDYDTSTNPSRAMAVRGNYFKIDSGNDTGSLFIQAYGGFIDNVTVENNYLLGGGYQLILEYHNNGYGTHMKAINNRFTSTGYGAGYVTGGSGWAQQTDNYKYDSSKLDGKGAAVSF